MYDVVRAAAQHAGGILRQHNACHYDLFYITLFETIVLLFILYHITTYIIYDLLFTAYYLFII
jgi:hypothetical protein